MTIESSLERIATALEKLAQEMGSPIRDTLAPTIKPAEIPVADTPAGPTTSAASTVLPFQQAAPAAVVELPFKDVPGLVAYTMQAYNEMGAEKGAKIQTVLSGLGYDNINNVKPEHFTPYYQQMEALKAGG